MQQVDIGSRIRELRLRDERSLSWLARNSGVSRTHLHCIETGQSSPSYDVIIKICNALQCRPASLVDAQFISNQEESTVEELKPLNITGEDNTTSSLVIQRRRPLHGMYFWDNMVGYVYPQLGASDGWEEARTNLSHLRRKFPNYQHRLVIVTTEVLSD